jgi:hypothetical protein
LTGSDQGLAQTLSSYYNAPIHAPSDSPDGYLTRLYPTVEDGKISFSPDFRKSSDDMNVSMFFIKENQSIK